MFPCLPHHMIHSFFIRSFICSWHSNKVCMPGLLLISKHAVMKRSVSCFQEAVAWLRRLYVLNPQFGVISRRKNGVERNTKDYPEIQQYCFCTQKEQVTCISTGKSAPDPSGFWSWNPGLGDERCNRKLAWQREQLIPIPMSLSIRPWGTGSRISKDIKICTCTSPCVKWCGVGMYPIPTHRLQVISLGF